MVNGLEFERYQFKEKIKGKIRFDAYVWWALGNPNWSDIKKTFLLPDDYEIYHYILDSDRIDIFVCSEFIPKTNDIITKLKPVYNHTFTSSGKLLLVTLDSIEVNVPCLTCSWLVRTGEYYAHRLQCHNCKERPVSQRDLYRFKCFHTIQR